MNEETKKAVISKYFSELAKKSHKKSPRSKGFYSKIGSMPHKRGRKPKGSSPSV